MERPISRFKPLRLACATLLAFALLLSCGLTAFAAGDFTLDIAQTTTPPTINLPLPPIPEDMAEAELYPSEVQTVIEGNTRKIVKTYILTAGQNPDNIPRESFTRDGWQYTLTDITEKRTSRTDTRSHTETVEINTDANDLNDIIILLAATLEYQSEDGYCGILTLDLSSVNCEAAGHMNSSYTVTAMREYPHLSTNDLSLIPKTITDNGRTLTLDDVSWEVQHYINVDYEDIPDSFRAVAKYTVQASRSVVTGYITTADYIGEVEKTVTGDTVYTAYFDGREINPVPKQTEPPTTIPTTTAPSTTEPSTEPPTTPPSTSIEQGGGNFPLATVLIVLAVLAAVAGAGAYLFFLRRNVRIYRDGFRVLVAKDKISEKSPSIDLSPLDGDRFGIEIDRFAAKKLNGHTVEVRHGTANLKHKIAFEGNAYRIEADFGANTIQAIY